MGDTVGRLLERCIERLKQAGIADAEISARLILQHRLKKTPTQLQLAYEAPVDRDLVKLIESDIESRSKHYPVQYIIGEVEFFNVRLKVNPAVLIPRPETEILVEEAMALADKFANPKILDIGTGSGNIAIALAANLKTARITAIDISEKALEQAIRNASLNCVSDKIEFIKGDCLNPNFLRSLGGFDMVVSNPPYVAESDYDNLQPEVKSYEPKIALVSEDDTFKYYKSISMNLKDILNKGGFIILEIGQGQERTVSDIFTGENPALKIRIANDLNSIARIVIGEMID